MALQKTNPLPVGRYTMDLPALSLPRLAAWAKTNRGKVVVHTVTSHPERGCVVHFDVVAKPGAFPFGLGYPNAVHGENESASSLLEELALLWVLWKLTYP